MLTDVVVSVLVLSGSVLAFVAAIGIVRFPDTLSRMHAATKPQTLGLILILLGALVAVGLHVDLGMLVLGCLFTLITAPVVGNRVGRLAYQEQRRTDELIAAEEMESGRRD